MHNSFLCQTFSLKKPAIVKEQWQVFHCQSSKMDTVNYKKAGFLSSRFLAAEIIGHINAATSHLDCSVPEARDKGALHEG